MYVSQGQESIKSLLNDIEQCEENGNCSDCSVDDKCNLCDTSGRICHDVETVKANCCSGSKLYSMNFWQLLMNIEVEK